jgi:serine protease Do
MKKWSVGFLLGAVALASLYFGPSNEYRAQDRLAYANERSNAANPVHALSRTFVELSKELVPSVVNISTHTHVVAPHSQFPDDLFRSFFEDFFGGSGSQSPFPHQPPRHLPGGQQRTHSLGTGFIIDETGLILTNHHVIGGADEVRVRFTDDESEDPTVAEILGIDPELDLALLRVDTKRKLKPLRLGDSDKVQVGEFVLAIGNPFGQGHSVTHGIVSAKDRLAPVGILARYIQTDAPINPGNSGGPLVNLRGEVIGMNNAIDARAQGIGFAIPSNLVKQVLPQLRTTGKVERGYLGIHVESLIPEIATQIGIDPTLKAPIVLNVQQGLPAEQAGMQNYDVILAVNGRRVQTAFDLTREVISVPVGEVAKVKILRNLRGKAEEIEFEVKVMARPSQQQAIPAARPQKKSQRGEKVATGLLLQNIPPDEVEKLELSEKSPGVRVSDVTGGAAADAQIQAGDIILEVNRKAIQSVDHFYSIVNQKKSYLLRVRRPLSGNQDSFLVRVLDLKDQS